MGIQPRPFLAHRCGHHLVTGRALLSGDEMLLRRTAERAAVGMMMLSEDAISGWFLRCPFLSSSGKGKSSFGCYHIELSSPLK